MTQLQHKWLSGKKTDLPKMLQQLSHNIRQATLEQLTHQLGYKNLRLSFEAYVALIAEEGSKQTDIARKLGVSKQSCNQVIKEIENAGYLLRQPDPKDGRGKLLQLTPLGLSLRQDGNNSIAKLEKRFVKICGRNAFDEAKNDVVTLCDQFNVPFAITDQRAKFSSLLFRLNDFIRQQLLNSLRELHPTLKPSHEQVLGLIDRHDLTISQLANYNNVTKQAMGATVKQLEQSGYILCNADSSDRRQVICSLSSKGRKLIADSAAAADKLYDKLQTALSQKKLAKLEQTLQLLANSLNSGEQNPRSEKEKDPNAIAQQLIKDLGEQQALALARALLNNLRAS